MQAAFGVKGLAGEAEVEGEELVVAVGVLVGGEFAEGVVENRPIPDGGVGAGLHHFARAAEVVGLDGESRAP